MTELKHIDIALRIAGYNFPKKDVETILAVMGEASPETTLEDIAKIETEIESKYEK